MRNSKGSGWGCGLQVGCFVFEKEKQMPGRRTLSGVGGGHAAKTR